jgi:hypothetical protein
MVRVELKMRSEFVAFIRQRQGVATLLFIRPDHSRLLFCAPINAGSTQESQRDKKRRRFG